MGASSYDLFNAIGIPTEQVIRLPDYHFIECERLFVPTILAGLSAELDNFFYPPEPAHWLRDRLTVACCEEDAENPPTPTRKVYISRKSAKQRVTGNEDEIIELVGSAGYEIIDPSDYSICEQVNIARETKQFISLAGSQTNLVNFAQPGARFCELKIKEYMERRILGYLRVFPLLGIEHIQVFYKELDDEDYTIDVGKLAVALQKFDFL